MAAEVWVATAPIWLNNVRAYNLSNIVPDSVVAQFGLEAEGLVERRAASNTGVPSHGVDPATQTELDNAIGSRAAVSEVFAGDGKFRVDKLPASVPRTVNGKAPAANGDVVLSAGDVGALPTSTTASSLGALPSTTRATDIGGLDQAAGDARYPRKGDLVVSVEDYGAKGDGTTDDTAALQRALDAANAGDVIAFRPGKTYKVKAPLTKTAGALNINGAGATIKLDAAFPAQTAETGVIDCRTGVTNVRVAGLKIDGSSGLLNGGAGFPNWSNFIELILVRNAIRVVIDDCTLTNFPSIGINVNNCTDVAITGNRVTNGMFHGIFVGTNDRVAIRDNVVTGRGNQGTDPAIGGIGILGQKTTRMTISGNTVSQTADSGIKTEGCSFVRALGNYIEDSGKDALKSIGYTGSTLISHVVYANNTVRRINAWRTDGSHLVGCFDVDTCVIIGNTIEGGGTRAEDAIRIDDEYGTVGNTTRVVIADNVARLITNALVRGDTLIGQAAVLNNVGDGNMVFAGITGTGHVKDNVITNGGTADSVNWGIDFLAAGTDLEVAGNTIADYAGGVRVSTGSAAAVDVIRVFGNRIRNTHDSGVRVDNFGTASTARLVNISQNVLVNTAKGAASTQAIRVGTATLAVTNAVVTNNVVDNPGANAVTYWLNFTGTVGAVTFADVRGNSVTGNVTNGLTVSGHTIPNRYAGLYFSSAPTWGSWARGDAVTHVAPVAGGTPGWICTSSGAPGTWNAMANLAP